MTLIVVLFLYRDVNGRGVNREALAVVVFFVGVRSVVAFSIEVIMVVAFSMEVIMVVAFSIEVIMVAFTFTCNGCCLFFHID